ncbi:MAG: 3-dehydroquinate synthase [Clostridia bacterium]|nr:3-dehydroquinate synthase [Clostridia bacterium]
MIIPVTASRPYDVVIERGALARAGERIRPILGDCRLGILTDDTVDALYGEALIASLAEAGYDAVKFTIPHGEESKNPENLFAFLSFLAENHLTRTDALVALGGGVVGDLCGLAAALYLRGVPFVQIPTTLLAAVDSSVGGKTAVDIPAGKNLVGAFWQPSLVICDPDTLLTLPEDTFRDGCAEVIKYGVILDGAFFERLKTPINSAETVESDLLDAAIARCVEIKRDVVNEDEFDRGLRGLLNFGHTLGHGIEKESNFTVTHGSAVAKGSVIAAKLAVELGLCGQTVVDEIVKILTDYGFDLSCPYSAEALYSAALSDKKRAGDNISLVLPETIGRCVLYKMPCADLLPLLKKVL